MGCGDYNTSLDSILVDISGKYVTYDSYNDSILRCAQYLVYLSSLVSVFISIYSHIYFLQQDFFSTSLEVELKANLDVLSTFNEHESTPLLPALTSLVVLAKEGLTSSTGFSVKKFLGLNINSKISVGMTGKSSGAGKWVIPKVWKKRMSEFSIVSVPSPIHFLIPLKPSPLH